MWEMGVHGHRHPGQASALVQHSSPRNGVHATPMPQEEGSSVLWTQHKWGAQDVVPKAGDINRVQALEPIQAGQRPRRPFLDNSCQPALSPALQSG